MKKIRVEDAIGMTLCHDMTAMRDGFKGPLFKRGHVIQAEDIESFLDIGKRYVFVWEDNKDEIHEEDAALRMSEMTKIDGVYYTGPSEGKMLMFSEVDGMFRVNKELLKKINMIGDITIASIPDHYPVKKDDRLASMRIVPLVTETRQIEEAENLCKDEKPFALYPYKHKKVGIIVTGSEIYSGRIKDKFEGIAKGKLDRFPHEVVGTVICDDDLEMIKSAAKKFIDEGCELVLFSGGMSVDPDDLTPTAIKELGSDIISYGVPSQPGNMTLVAYLGDVCLLGIPGAAISMPTTVFDVVLPQVFCSVKFTKEDLINLADGGLCQLCKTCHWPICTFGRY